MTNVTPLPKVECPRCGAGAHERINSGTRWGRPVVRRRCLKCGHITQEATRWTQPPAPPPPPAAPAPPARNPGDPVEYHVVKCPRCDSKNTRVTSTQRPVRMHKCQDCGHPFKSVEA